uniref:Uncharacterized protein n=1 Tax=Panagrolaimus davidi TaxID=227884 RepID=A0A914Q0I0_9BILA
MRYSFAILSITLIIFATTFSSVNADWWDDFIDKIHEKVTDGADFIKEKAGPTIREKFDSLKAQLQDPETHEKVQTWVKEEAFPVIKEKFNQASEFLNDEVVPEVKKVFDAGVEGHRRVFTDENGDTVIKQTVDN